MVIRVVLRKSSMYHVCVHISTALCVQHILIVMICPCAKQPTTSGDDTFTRGGRRQGNCLDGCALAAKDGGGTFTPGRTASRQMLDGCALTAKPGTALLPLVRRRQGKCLTDVPWRQKPGTALSSLDRRRQGKCLGRTCLDGKNRGHEAKKNKLFLAPRTL